MATLGNVLERIHATITVTTPFHGTLGDLVPPAFARPRDFLVLLIGVPPQSCGDDELLLIERGGGVLAMHTLRWLMDFYTVNAPSKHVDFGRLLSVSCALSERLMVAMDEHGMPPAGTLAAYADVTKQIAEACTGQQAIAGVRLARAVPLRDRDIAIRTSGNSSVTVHLGGLLSREVEEPSEADDPDALYW